MNLVPREQWPSFDRLRLPPVRVWRDLDFLAMLYEVPNHSLHGRLTVCRAAGVKIVDGHAVYRDGITWDDLMTVKAACGFRDSWAVEVFPPDSYVVNVANMRHLWLLPEAPTFAWHKPQDRDV